MGKIHASQGVWLRNLIITGCLCSWMTSASAALVTLVDEDFNAANGGFTVVDLGPVEGPWTYDGSSGSWKANGSTGLATSSETGLDCPLVTLAESGEVTLQFNHRYNFEISDKPYDGGQVQMSVNGGAFQPVTGFSQNGYTHVGGGANSLLGEPMFCDASAGYSAGSFITSVASLGVMNAGDTLIIRLLGSWDGYVVNGPPNWELDHLQLTQDAQGNLPPGPSSTTEVFVVKASVIAGNDTGEPKINYLSLPALAGVVYAGTVTAINPGSLTDAAANWSDDAFNGVNGSFYIQFETGLMADITDTVAGSQTLNYPGTLPELIPPGTHYCIRRHMTIADVFGPANETGLQAGSSASQADNILILLPETQETHIFFYSNVSGYEGWFRSDFQPADNTVIYPEQGFMIQRKSPGDLTLYFNGTTQGTPTKAPVFAGFNLLGTISAGSTLTLDQLNLYSGDPATGVSAGSNLDSADNLILVDSDGTASSLFYSDFPGFEGWYDASFSPAGDQTIAPGTAFFVQRKAPRGTFRWSIPEE